MHLRPLFLASCFATTLAGMPQAGAQTALEQSGLVHEHLLQPPSAAPATEAATQWSARDWVPAASGVHGLRVHSADRALLERASHSVRGIQASLDGVLVAYQPRHDSEMRRVGLPLAHSSESGLGLAYDLSGKSFMAQWRFHQNSADGGQTDYRAFVNESGQFSLSVRRNF